VGDLYTRGAGNEDRIRILLVPMKEYPCQHAMLETVYAQLLPERGYDITWVMDSSTIARPARIDWNGTRVFVMPSGARRGVPAFLGRRLGWLRVLLAMARLLRTERFDVVQVRNAVSAGVLGVLLARRAGAKFVFQFSFPLQEQFIDATRLEDARTQLLWIAYKRFQIRVRGWVMRRAGLVLAISQEMRRRLEADGVAPERIQVVPMGTDCPLDPPPADVQELRRSLGLEGHRVVLYFGSISHVRRLDFLVRVAARLRPTHPDLRWVLLGPSYLDADSDLRRTARDLGVSDQVLILPRVPRAEVPRYIALADVAVSPILSSPVFVVSSPTKLVEALSMGCPVVATPIPDQVEVLQASGGGELAPLEEEAFGDAILRLLRDPEAARTKGHAGRAWVRAHRSYDLLADQVEKRYLDLLEERSGGI
jgi:glycosyltransferase involved in cell wall biosynthesis